MHLVIFLSGEVAVYQAEQKQPPVICEKGTKMTKVNKKWECK
jgi:hypothetical protein